MYSADDRACLHMVPCFYHAFDIHVARSIGVDVAVMDGYQVSLLAKSIAVKKRLDAGGEYVGKDMGEGGLAGGKLTRETELEDRGLV